MGRNQPIHQFQKMKASYAQRTFGWSAVNLRRPPVALIGAACSIDTLSS